MPIVKCKCGKSEKGFLSNRITEFEADCCVSGGVQTELEAGSKAVETVRELEITNRMYSMELNALKQELIVIKAENEANKKEVRDLKASINVLDAVEAEAEVAQTPKKNVSKNGK